MPLHPRISKLMQSEEKLKADMLKAVFKARGDVKAIIQVKSGKALNAVSRDRVYKDVSGVYDSLANGLDALLKNMTAVDSKDWHKEAVKDIEKAEALSGKSILKFDVNRIKKYFEVINPDTASELTGVFTDKMKSGDLRALRQAFVEASRAQQIEGLTAQQTQKRLQSSWADIAGNLNDHKFIDSRGTAWSNARYLDMLARTTAQRVSRESYMDTLANNGDDLVQIQNVDNEACELCQAWDKVIVSISGESKDYPSYNEAFDAGWSHPNCRCQTFRVDPDLDKTQLDAQAAANTPSDLTDIDSIAEYSKEFEAV